MPVIPGEKKPRKKTQPACTLAPSCPRSPASTAAAVRGVPPAAWSCSSLDPEAGCLLMDDLLMVEKLGCLWSVNTELAADPETSTGPRESKLTDCDQDWVLVILDSFPAAKLILPWLVSWLSPDEIKMLLTCFDSTKKKPALPPMWPGFVATKLGHEAPTSWDGSHMEPNPVASASAQTRLYF